GDVALTGSEKHRGEGDSRRWHALEPHADADHVEIDRSAARRAVADLRIAIPAGFRVDVAREVVGYAGTDEETRAIVRAVLRRRQAALRARFELGVGTREAGLAVKRPLCRKRVEADARERKRARLELAVDRVAAGGRAVVEAAEALVRALKRKVIVETIAGVDAKARVGLIEARGRADALVGERAVDIAAVHAEAAAADVDARVPAGLVGALRVHHAGGDDDCECSDCLPVHRMLLLVEESAGWLASG